MKGILRAFRGQRVLVFLVMLFFGTLLSVQVRSLAEENARLQRTKQDYEYYANLLESEIRFSNEQRTKIEDLSVRKASLLESSLIQSGDEALLAELRKVRALAGFTPVNGPGLVITLDDSEARVPGTNPADALIHDGDIRHILDLLRGTSALAFAINGERIVSTSEIVCNGPSVLINGQKYPVPYVITVSGDPVVMRLALESDPFIALRRKDRIRILVEEREEVTVPGFRDTARIPIYISALEATG